MIIFLREDPAMQHQGTRLPSFLLSNIRSFGNSEETDKSTEIEALLDVNDIDIACLTETWLTNISKNQVSFDKYTHFSMVRKNAKCASGGVSILIHEDFTARELDVNVQHLNIYEAELATKVFFCHYSCRSLLPWFRFRLCSRSRRHPITLC